VYIDKGAVKEEVVVDCRGTEREASFIMNL
jgi:hypothetical protein